MAKVSKPVSEIDRLIELASDEKPVNRAIEREPLIPANALFPAAEKDPAPSMWRVLLQLRALLPYLSRLLPLLERGLLGTNITGSTVRVDTTRLDRGIAEVEGRHRDLSIQLKVLTEEMKFLQEQVTWFGKSLEKQLQKQDEMAAGVTALRTRVTVWAVVLLVLLLTLIGLTAVLLLRHSS